MVIQLKYPLITRDEGLHDNRDRYCSDRTIIFSNNYFIPSYSEKSLSHCKLTWKTIRFYIDNISQFLGLSPSRILLRFEL